ncbi:uncharacterized protein LOC142876870 [Microcebus murinus]|uniref:uncharacterized protein LOC142876870 n=1 Tax=Microcebus murinus TaxID=30608 RepID=UPI003F6CBB16
MFQKGTKHQAARRNRRSKQNQILRPTRRLTAANVTAATCLAGSARPPGPGARPSARRDPRPGSPDSSPRHLSCRRGLRTQRRPGPVRPPHLPGPRVCGSALPSPPRPRARAAGRDAGCPPSAPRQRSPRRPAAAPSGRKRLRSNRFQLLQTKPPGRPAGRGRRAAGRGLTSRPAPSQPIGGHARGAGPRVSGRGSRLRLGIPGGPSTDSGRGTGA